MFRKKKKAWKQLKKGVWATFWVRAAPESWLKYATSAPSSKRLSSSPHRQQHQTMLSSFFEPPLKIVCVMPTSSYVYHFLFVFEKKSIFYRVLAVSRNDEALNLLAIHKQYEWWGSCKRLIIVICMSLSSGLNTNKMLKWERPELPWTTIILNRPWITNEADKHNTNVKLLFKARIETGQTFFSQMALFDSH